MEAYRTERETSSGVHSDLFVGFDMGMMMGRLQWTAVSLTTSSLKVPGTVESPRRQVGL